MRPMYNSMLSPVRKTMLGPCMDRIRAMFWLFQQYICFWMPQMAHIFTEESGKPNRRKLSMSDCWDHIRAMFAPYQGHVLGHIGAMFLLFLQYLCFQVHEIAIIFTEESCMTNRRIPFNVKLLGPYMGHVWAITGPCFAYFYHYAINVFL